MKKFVSSLLTLCLCFTYSAVPITVSAQENHMTLSFAPADAVSNGDGSVIYLSDKEGKKVYSINTATFEQKVLSFDLMPESLCFKDGKLYVALCEPLRSYYWWTEDQRGAFAVIDGTSFTTIMQVNIDLDPYSIAVSNSGNIYIGSGSGQWTEMHAFRPDGTLLDKLRSFRQSAIIRYNAFLNRIYIIDTDSSPSGIGMEAIYLNSDGTFSKDNNGRYYWKYHYDFVSAPNFILSPDGQYIFNNIGYMLSCSVDRVYDMVKQRELNKSFNDIAFDLQNNLFYLSVSNNRIHSFSYDRHVPQNSFITDTGSPERIFLTQADIIALTKDASGIFRIERICKSSALPPDTDNDYGIVFKSEVHAAVYSPATHKTYIIDKGTKELLVFDHDTEKIETTVALQTRPDGVNLSADGNFIWIVNDSSYYLATEFNINTLVKTRDILFSVPINNDPINSRRHISTGAGKIFVADGQWTPQMHVFDQQTLEQINDFGVEPGIGGMYIDKEQKFLYTWYKLGTWGGSGLYKYDITGDSALQVDQIEPEAYSLISRDPINSPFIPHDDKLILKMGTFSTENLSTYSNIYPETVYTIDAINNLAAGYNGIYNLTTGELIQRTNFYGSNAIVFDKNGNLYFSKNGTMQRHRVELISVDTSNQSIYLGQTRQINVNAIFSDGVGSDVTSDCTFESSNPAVVEVNPDGLLSAVGSGTAIITVNYDDFSTSFAVGVGIQLTSLSVKGYDIDFSPSKTLYWVDLPSGTVKIPEITYQAAPGCFVDMKLETEYYYYTIITKATLSVKDSDGIFTSTYEILFYSYRPYYYSKYPFVINKNVIIDEDGLSHLYLDVLDSPYYLGETPEKFTLVIQGLSLTLEPMFIEMYENRRQMICTYKSDCWIDIMVVDEPSRIDYIGVPIAEPVTTQPLEMTGIVTVNASASLEPSNYSIWIDKTTYSPGSELIVVVLARQGAEKSTLEILKGEELLMSTSVIRFINIIGLPKYTLPENWEGDDYVIRAGRGTDFDSVGFKIRSNTFTPTYSVSGKINSYNPKNESIIQLLQDDRVMYETFIPVAQGSGQAEQSFTIEGVSPGTYTLVIQKAAHLKFTVHNLVVGEEDLDLTLDERESVKLMKLICGDLNGDGQINSGDLLVLLSYYLELGEGILADLNGDGQVNSSDLLILLGNYLELDVEVFN